MMCLCNHEPSHNVFPFLSFSVPLNKPLTKSGKNNCREKLPRHWRIRFKSTFHLKGKLSYCIYCFGSEVPVKRNRDFFKSINLTFEWIVPCLQQSERERDVNSCHFQSRYLNCGIDGGHRWLANRFFALNYSAISYRYFLIIFIFTFFYGLQFEDTRIMINHFQLPRESFSFLFAVKVRHFFIFRSEF